MCALVKIPRLIIDAVTNIYRPIWALTIGSVKVIAKGPGGRLKWRHGARIMQAGRPVSPGKRDRIVRAGVSARPAACPKHVAWGFVPAAIAGQAVGRTRRAGIDPNPFAYRAQRVDWRLPLPKVCGGCLASAPAAEAGGPGLCA